MAPTEVQLNDLEDHDLLVRIATQNDQMYSALFGTDSKNGLVIDVSRVKSKMSFIQWAGGAGTLLLAGLIIHALGLG